MENVRSCRKLQDKQAIHILREKVPHRLQVQRAPGRGRGHKHTMVGVESQKRDEQGWLRELGLRAALGLGKKKELVPLGKDGAGRTSTTGETILCHIATTDATPGVVDSSPTNG